MRAHDIHRLRILIATGRFDVSRHGIPHQLKEGFTPDDIAEAIRRGQIIEEYPERKRCLVWGRIKTEVTSDLDLHVVCDVSDPEWLHVVTAYAPDSRQWHLPPKQRRK